MIEYLTKSYREFIRNLAYRLINNYTVGSDLHLIIRGAINMADQIDEIEHYDYFTTNNVGDNSEVD